MSIAARTFLLVVALLGAVAPVVAAGTGDDCAGCCCGPQASAGCPCEAESGPSDPAPAPDRAVAPEGPTLPLAEVTSIEVVAEVAHAVRAPIDGDFLVRPPSRLVHCVRTL